LIVKDPSVLYTQFQNNYSGPKPGGIDQSVIYTIRKKLFRINLKKDLSPDRKENTMVKPDYI